MTDKESRQLLEYANSLYPSARMTEVQIEKTSRIWAAEFRTETLARVTEAFRVAQTESPDWMPSVPKVRAALESLDAIPKVRTKEDEFRDTHGGKSPSEWREYEFWASSREGMQKIQAFKKQLKDLIGL